MRPDYVYPMHADPVREAAHAIDLWSDRVKKDADRVAFKHKADGAWQSTTWGQSDAAAREVAAGLAAAGIAPGDKVCILSQSRLEWMLCDVGILLCGGVPVPIYASNTSEQCAFIVRDAGARAVIVEDAAQLEKMLAVRPHLSPPPQLIFVDGDAVLERPDAKGRTHVRIADVRPVGDAQVCSLTELRERGRAWQASNAGVLEDRTKFVSADTMFTIIYTSGTTGTPKGALLSHRNLTSAMASACRAMTLFREDEQLLFLPMAHVLGRELAWVAVQGGITTWFAESIAKLKDNLMEARPTYMAGVPRVFEKFYAGVQAALKKGSPIKLKLVDWALGVGRRVAATLLKGNGSGPLGFSLSLERAIADKLVFSKLRARLGLDRCRFLISGGAPLAPEIAEFFLGTGVLILEGYGLTETMSAAFLNRLDRFKFGTVGPALDVVESKVADDGEILMRGPSVFRQYHNNPVATEEAVDADGWYHSGDIGQIDDGFLRITDRKKDLIVTAGGKKIAPQPIENAIKTRSPLVGQAVVYGDRRPYCVALVTPSEEAVKRFGSANGGGIADPTALRAEIEKDFVLLNQGLAPYEQIKTFALLPSDFTESAGEMTPSLKVKRKVVIDKYRDILEGLYKSAHAES
jgi:long-chain acyl-CoA synthetase